MAQLAGGGGGLLAILTVAGAETQPAGLVATTLYVVAVVGDAIGLVQFVHDNPIAGLQVNVALILLDEADSCNEPPAHIVALAGKAATVGVLSRNTTT